MEGGKANRYAALQEGEGRSEFCQKVRYITVERFLIGTMENLKFRDHFNTVRPTFTQCV